MIFVSVSNSYGAISPGEIRAWKGSDSLAIIYFFFNGLGDAK